MRSIKFMWYDLFFYKFGLNILDREISPRLLTQMLRFYLTLITGDIIIDKLYSLWI